MHRSALFSLICFSAACGSLESYNGPVAPASELDPVPPLEAQYRMVTMAVVADVDTDADGIVDNHLPDALAALDQLALDEDFGLEAFNARISDNLATSTRVLLEASSVAGDLELTVVAEAEIVEEALLTGRLLDAEGAFVAGPADLSLPMIAFDDAPPVPIVLAEVNVDGELTVERAAGRMRLILPVETIVEDVIATIVPETGWDVDGDGVDESKDEVMDLAWSLVPLLADTETADGEPGISAVIDFEALEEAW